MLLLKGTLWSYGEWRMSTLLWSYIMCFLVMFLLGLVAPHGGLRSATCTIAPPGANLVITITISMEVALA